MFDASLEASPLYLRSKYTTKIRLKALSEPTSYSTSQPLLPLSAGWRSLTSPTSSLPASDFLDRRHAQPRGHDLQQAAPFAPGVHDQRRTVRGRRFQRLFGAVKLLGCRWSSAAVAEGSGEQEADNQQNQETARESFPGGLDLDLDLDPPHGKDGSLSLGCHVMTTGWGRGAWFAQ